jgi:hypothetical protein
VEEYIIRGQLVSTILKTEMKLVSIVEGTVETVQTITENILLVLTILKTEMKLVSIVEGTVEIQILELTG